MIGSIVRPNMLELKNILENNGIDFEKWHAKNKEMDNKLLDDYMKCFKQGVSNRLFNQRIHNEICQRKINSYIKKISKIESIKKG